MGDEIAQSSVNLLSSNGLETVSSNVNFVKDLQQKPDIKPLMNNSINPSQGFLAPQTYLNTTGIQMDYLDSSSSATSVCLSQNDIHLQQNTNPMCFNSQSMMFRDVNQEEEVQGDPRHNISFGANNIESQLGMPVINDPLIIKGGMVESGKDFSNNGMLSSYENPKEAQPELSSSMVSQSFGVPDITFNSIDSGINDNSFLNRGAWAPPPQFQRLRTYTKVWFPRILESI